MTQVSSLYLHVPFCRHLCNYCDFYKKQFDPGSKQIEDFHQFLKASWIRHQRYMEGHSFSWAPLETIYLGGGTPSLWGEMGAEFFHTEILSQLKTKSPEFTMEVDPGTWTPQMLESWKKNGLNRISIGTQTLNPEFLTILDRAHTLRETRDLLKFCQEEKWNFSLDFLLGIPFSQEKKRNILDELEDLLSYSPQHVSLYILNARSKYPLIQEMPEDDYIREEYLLVSDFLTKRGFHHYEVSNFALPGYESKHNIKYWKGESVAALGPTGTGLLAKSSSEASRYKWKVSSAEIEVETLGLDEIVMEETYLGLRTSAGWRPRQVDEKLIQLFGQWQKLGYGSYKEGLMQLNALGFLMMDSLMNDLFLINPAAKTYR